MNKMNEKKNMNISTDTDKALDQIQLLFMIETLNKQGLEGK